ncbi:MAG: hypothetical protein AAF631_13660 [Pseudomonadota bacterium]
MTLVSHDHRFIFLKTQKTAGTALEMALEPFCAPPGHKPKHWTQARVSAHGIIGARGLNVVDDDTAWFGHQPAADIRAALGDNTFDRYTKLTVLRNPFDKVISWFHWKRDKSGKALKHETRDETIAAFRRSLRQVHRGGALTRFAALDWDVCAIDGDLVLDRVLRTETLPYDLWSFAHDRRLDPARLCMEQPKTAARARDTITVPDYYDARSERIVHDAFAWVFEIGDYSRQAADAGRATETLATASAMAVAAE